MLPALTQALPRAGFRCFATRAAVCNSFPKRYAVQPAQSSYQGLQIPDPTNPGWAKHPVANAVVAPDARTPAEIWRENSKHNVAMLQRTRVADAYQGRQVQVRPGNFTGALKELETILAHNRVKQTLWSSQRHEKRGVKRRRIKSEQWRKHFAHQVRKNVQLVHKIRRRGA
ncbi:hypothetical protein FB45DRAFT_912877 [Roridomyces roridus]|uniref:Uncharacterized protein n=1 Tax=Roridomyces roridus TaxID=1738132 RepID=A0AAD7BWE0_9AGAR|nr:hypothetical protein FB45DRAFT_912877 [Roridomyces roridus]